jgi:hypothetical protein
VTHDLGDAGYIKKLLAADAATGEANKRKKPNSKII